MTPEQIEAKKQHLQKLTKDAKQLKDELVEAGAWPLDEEDLDGVAGGHYDENGERIHEGDYGNPRPDYH